MPRSLPNFQLVMRRHGRCCSRPQKARGPRICRIPGEAAGHGFLGILTCPFPTFDGWIAPAAGWLPGRPEGATISADLVDRGGV